MRGAVAFDDMTTYTMDNTFFASHYTPFLHFICVDLEEAFGLLGFCLRS